MPKSRKRRMRDARKAKPLTEAEQYEHIASLRERVHAARKQWAKGLDSLAAYQRRLHEQKLT
jgi:hypothetical protein